MADHDNEEWDIASGVGVTALAVALCRALETNRPDSIAQDPFAASFVTTAGLPESVTGSMPRPDAAPAELADHPLWGSMPTYIATRTRFFDDYFRAVGEAGIRQVVVVAAGLDTRAFRLDWSADTVVFELDQPRVLSFKDEVLAKQGATTQCVRRLVPADLREDWVAALSEAGFDPARPTAWLIEGLLSFLPAAAEAELFARVGELSAPGSQVAMDAVAGNRRHMVAKPSTGFGSAAERTPFTVDSTLWSTEHRPEPVDVLREDGWTVTVDRIARAAERYGRPIQGVMVNPANGTMLLVATR